MAIRLSSETIAAETNASERYLLRRVGYGGWAMILIRLSDSEAHNDAYDWDNRTMRTAHLHLENHWDEIASGSVVDVQFILGETSAPKQSEQFETYGPKTT